MKKLFFIIFYLILTIDIFAGTIPYDVKYSRISSKHFTIIFQKNDEKKAINILNIAEAVHRRLVSKFNIDDTINTYIVLLNNTAIANGSASILPSNVIILYDAVPLLSIEKSLLNFYNWTEELIIHEYTHILHLNQANDVLYGLKKIGVKFAVLNPLLPISSIEGLAVGVESYETPMGRAKSSYMEMIIRTGVYENDIPSIDEISTFANKIPNGVGPYIWGGSFHYYLINRFSLEKVTKSYNKNSGCLSLLNALNDNKFSSCTYSFVSCFPFNSIFAAENKVGYYKVYNEWIDTIKKEYKRKIVSLGNVIEPDSIGFKDYFAEIYNIDVIGNTIYLSGNSYDYGYGLYKYNLKLKQLKQVIPDRFISDFMFYKNKIYFLEYNIEDNAYSYFNLYKYDILSGDTARVKNKDKIISFYIEGNKLFFITHNGSIYEFKYIDINNNREKLIKRLSGFEVVDNICVIKNKLFFIGKRENGFIDVYKFDLMAKKITRITDNSGIEFSLKIYKDELYFIADYNNVFNLYSINGKEIFKLSNVVTGISDFAVKDNNFYVVSYHTTGYKIERLRRELNLKVTNINVKNMYYTDKEIEVYQEPKTGAEDFSYFRNIFANLIYFPLINLQTDYSYTVGAYIYFTDVLLKNKIESRISYNPNDRYINMEILYKNDFNKFSYILYGGINNYYMNNYEMKMELDYYFTKLYKSLSIYSGFFYQKYSGLLSNYFYSGIRYNNEKRYMYSITAEKGWNIDFKYLFFNKYIGSIDNANIVIYSVRKNFSLFFKHNVLSLKLQGGNVLDNSMIQFYGVGNHLIDNLVNSDLYLTLNTIDNSLYFFNDNYLYLISEYHFPVVWIERGILNMPLFLRNINMNLYMNNFNGYNDIKRLKFYNIIGVESNFDFYFYYRIGGVLTFGIKSEMENFENYKIYLKLRASL